jgi:hypothetical protein
MPTPAHGSDPAPRTLVCVPLTPLDAADDNRTIEEMQQAKSGGADIIELRIDSIFDGSTGSDTEDGALIRRIRSLIDACPLPLILTCRIASEGGDYVTDHDGDESDRISLFEKLTAASKTPPAYLDVEWASFSRSANIAQKVRLCVRHPGQLRDVASGLILVSFFDQLRAGGMSVDLVADMDVDYISTNLEVSEERAQDILTRAKANAASLEADRFLFDVEARSLVLNVQESYYDLQALLALGRPRRIPAGRPGCW